MKQKVMERLNAEMTAYRKYLVSGIFTAGELLEKSYEVAVKQLIMDAMEHLYEADTVADKVWKWLQEQNCVLDYLYDLWMDADYSFVPELAEVMKNELLHDMEVQKDE